MDFRSIGYQQTQFFAEDPSLVANKIEDHRFDRKSIRISPEALANVLIGFANADGGALVIGVENDGTVTGVDAHTDQVNKLRQAAVDFTSPPVRHSAQFLSCTRDDGISDHVLAIEVPPSPHLHRNNRDEAYLRVGDQNRKLTLEAAQELLYDKGNSVYDGLVAPESDFGDLDPDLMSEFASNLSTSAESQQALKARGLLIDRDSRLIPSYAAILLFGASPEAHLPGAFIRILRYDGKEIRLGTRSNLILDMRIGGALPSQIRQAQDVLLSNL